MNYINLFAGAGGWDVAAQRLGLSGVGIELDRDAAATRTRAGFQTMTGDVRDVPPLERPWS